MNENQNTKEKSCVFYVSDYHFEMISLPYISKKLEEEKEVIILTENDLEDTVKTLTLKINLKEDKKRKLLNINWKNTKIQKNNQNFQKLDFVKVRNKWRTERDSNSR